MSIIGQMTKSRGTFGEIKGITKIVPDKKTIYNRKKEKNKLRKGDY